MNKLRWPIALAAALVCAAARFAPLGAVGAPPRAAAEVSPAEDASVDETDEAPSDDQSLVTGAVSELNVVRPKWLVAAEKLYDEGVKAQEGGDAKLAGKRFKTALKILASKTGPAGAALLKDEVGSLFAKLEEQFIETASTAAPVAQGLEVSEQELQAAPAAQTAPAARPHAIPIDEDDPLVKKYVAIYTAPGPRRNQMQQALDRLGRYRAMFARNLKDAGLPKELIYLPVVESECKNVATSRAGAVGLWQLMSQTGRNLGLKINYWIDERRDPEKSTQAALQYLKQLYAWFDDWHLALAAYNRGEYGIERDMKFSRSPDFARLSERQAIPNETEHYVPKFMACVLIAENAAAYGFRVEDVPPAVPDEVSIDKPLDLKVAADCADVTEADMQELNPTLRLWCTPKNIGSFKLKIPAGAKAAFQAKLAQVKDWTPSSGQVKYHVKKGDMLGSIAKKYRTTAKQIQHDNRIRDPRSLRPGQVLVIRPGRRYQGD